MLAILRLGSLGFMIVAFPVLALAGDLSVVSAVKPQTVVAAGFGFQDEEVSSITVKSYDAQTGQVLSADTYELDIKDDGPPSSHPRTRIFAGGVGPGNGSLSEFTLRVYDASNGRFLWEGRLNLTAGDHPEVGTHRVVARLQPHAVVTKVASRPKEAGAPHFVLRALNPQTGQLVWADEFSTEIPEVRIQRVSRSVIGMTGSAPRDIDFRIKMPDQAGRRWLWEDKVEPAEDSEDAVPDQSDETAGYLRRDRQPTTLSAHPASAPSSGIGTARRIAIIGPESRWANSVFS
jgi:hypothetical protein